MSKIKIADLNQNPLELRTLEDWETAKIIGGADFSNSTFNLSDASGMGEQKVAIVVQSPLSNNSEQLGISNSNYTVQSNYATAD